jgi:hypothetical protein
MIVDKNDGGSQMLLGHDASSQKAQQSQSRCAVCPIHGQHLQSNDSDVDSGESTVVACLIYCGAQRRAQHRHVGSLISNRCKLPEPFSGVGFKPS